MLFRPWHVFSYAKVLHDLEYLIQSNKLLCSFYTKSFSQESPLILLQMNGPHIINNLNQTFKGDNQLLIVFIHIFSALRLRVLKIKSVNIVIVN
jgi:hypothetical protein